MPFGHDKTGEDTPLRAVPRFKASEELEILLAPIAAKDTPEARLLCYLARSSSRTEQEVRWQSPVLVETERQATRTNGRVTKVENLIRVAKVGVITVLLVLIAGALLFPSEMPMPLRRLIELLAG